MAWKSINGETYQVVAFINPDGTLVTLGGGSGSDGSSGTSPTLAVTAALGAGTEIVVASFTRFALQVQNTGANALNAFEISTRNHASAGWIPRLNAAAHYTAPPSGSILRACADGNGAVIDVTTLAAGTIAALSFDLRDFYAQAIRIRASSAAGTTLQFYTGGS